MEYSGDECRSKKVRRILGAAPPFVVRCGTGVVVIATIIVLLVICLLIDKQTLVSVF